MQILSQTPFTKKASYNSTSLQDKTTMSDDFELVEDEMSLRQAKRYIFNVITYYVKSGTRIAEQACICVYKAYTFIILFNDRSFC